MIHLGKHHLKVHKQHPRELLPHLREKQHVTNRKSLVFAIGVSTVLTGLFFIALLTVKIPLTVVLPTSAPIWVGISALLQNHTGR